MDRDELFDYLENLPADRLANRPSRKEDFRPALEVDFEAAEAYRQHHEKMMLASELGRGQLAQYDYTTRELQATARRDLQNRPEFLAARKRMQAEVDFRRTLGTEPRMWGQVVGGGGFVSTRNRTPHDVAATERAEAAVVKVERLAFTRGDFAALLAEVWRELQAADEAAGWHGQPTTPVEPPRKTPVIRKYAGPVIAELE